MTEYTSTNFVPNPTGPRLTIATPYPIVSLCKHGARVFLATERRVYELTDGVWVPMLFVYEGPTP